MSRFRRRARARRPSLPRRWALGAALLLGSLATLAAEARAQAPSDSGTYLVRHRGQTIVTERFVRWADSLHVELSALSGEHAVVGARLAPSALVTRLHAREFSPVAGDTAAAGTVVLTFEQDGAALFVTIARRADTVRVATWADAVAYVNPSPSFMEQIVRRARQIGGDRVSVPVFTPSNGGQTFAAEVEFAADGVARLTMGGVTVELRLDRSDRLVGGQVPAHAIVIERAGG